MASSPGWRPGDDDDGPDAVAWRARTALRRADRGLSALDTLNKNVETLNSTIESWSATWGKHWATLAKIAWGLGIPLALAILIGLGKLAWDWFSTLHH